MKGTYKICFILLLVIGFIAASNISYNMSNRINSAYIQNTNIYTKGVLDRFEAAEQAVILLEKEGDEIIIPRQDLPPGSTEGTWFNIKRTPSEMCILGIDRQMTEREFAESNHLRRLLLQEK